MGVQYEPLHCDNESASEMLAVKVVDADVPAPTTCVVHVDPVPPSQSSDKWHFLTACLGTSLFHCFGLAGTLLLCPTKKGKAGAAAGFSYLSFKVAVFALVALAVVWHTRTHTHAPAHLHPEDFESQSSCEAHGGQWGTPDFHDYSTTTSSTTSTSTTAASTTSSVSPSTHHLHGRGSKLEGQHFERAEADEGEAGSPRPHHPERTVDEIAFGIVLRTKRGVEHPPAQCICPHLYFPAWDHATDSIVCQFTGKLWLLLGGLFLSLAVFMVLLSRRYWKQAKAAEGVPHGEVVMVGIPVPQAV